MSDADSTANAQSNLALPYCEGVEYRLIPGFDNYAVSDCGTVQSRLNGRWGIGAWHVIAGVAVKHRGGYIKVALCKDGRQIQRYVHDLVLEAFVGPKQKGMEACHFPDRTTSNNHLRNLRWGTRLDNANDCRQHGTHFTPFGKIRKISDQQRREIRMKHVNGMSTRKIAEQFGVHHSVIWQIVARKACYSKD